MNRNIQVFEKNRYEIKVDNLIEEVKEVLKELNVNCWKKILWQSGKIAFIFSVSMEMLQLLLRLGTFQLSDIFYNTVGGMIGGLMYCTVMKARKHL